MKSRWIPRDENPEADALSKGHWRTFMAVAGHYTIVRLELSAEDRDLSQAILASQLETDYLYRMGKRTATQGVHRVPYPLA